MITAGQLNEKLANEKDPLHYIDEEVARFVDEMGGRCGNIQETLSAYRQRAEESDQIDMQKLKEDLMKLGELYWETNLFLKARKAQVKRQNRARQIDRAQADHRKWMEQRRDHDK